MRINGLIQPDADSTHTTAKVAPQNLHPSTDPERELDIRYRRFPALYGRTFERVKGNGNVKIQMDDSHVIPYNPYLLLKYGCHINIEYVFGQKACKYIFKYLLKGTSFITYIWIIVQII